VPETFTAVNDIKLTAIQKSLMANPRMSWCRSVLTDIKSFESQRSPRYGKGRRSPLTMKLKMIQMAPNAERTLIAINMQFITRRCSLAVGAWNGAPPGDSNMLKPSGDVWAIQRCKSHTCDS
jgi:hypothetical protein